MPRQPIKENLICRGCKETKPRAVFLYPNNTKSGYCVECRGLPRPQRNSDRAYVNRESPAMESVTEKQIKIRPNVLEIEARLFKDLRKQELDL